MSITKETPDMMYGALKANVDISGLTLSKALDNFKYLLDDDRWMKVGNGFNDINEFLKTVDLSDFKFAIDQRKEVSKKLADLKASQRNTANALGVGTMSINRDLNQSVPNVTPKEIDEIEDAESEEVIIEDVPSGTPTPTPGLSSKEIYQKAKEDKAKEIKKEEKIAEREAEIEERKTLAKNFDVSLTNLINANSVEYLKTLQDKTFDVVITDPPYGINYKSNHSKLSNAVTKDTLLNDGKEDAFKLLDDVCKVLVEKTADDAHLYFFCSFSVFSDFERIISKYFTIKTPLVWDKENHGSGDLVYDWGSRVELIIYAIKGKKKLEVRRDNVLRFSRLSPTKYIHPTQKPVELLQELMRVSCKNDSKIIDPFMGSGSTVKAANLLGLNAVGVELDNDVYKSAALWISE